MLSVIDGTRAIEEGEGKGQLLLIHKIDKEERLNDPDKIGLHDLYNAND